MTFWLASLLTAAAISPAADSRSQAEWNLTAPAESSCEASAQGRADDALGASVFIACDDAGDLANAAYKLSANGLRQRRLTITGDVRANGTGASLWIKVMRGQHTLLFESTADQAMFEDAAPMRRSLSVVVPPDATAIAYGVRLQGSGQVEADRLRVAVSGEGAAMPEAQRVLDAALDIVRQAARRSDADWQLLEMQARIFAAGARETSDVYPAIQYLLVQVGDPRSLLLKPAIAVMFRTTGEAGAATRVYALPDGAKLVLSMPLSVPDTRTAKVLSTQVAY